MLRSDPASRPTIDELLNDEFFTSGYIPSRLPTSCLTVAPRFSIAPSGLELNGRKPLTALNKGRSWCGRWGWAAVLGEGLPGPQQRSGQNTALPRLCSQFLGKSGAL